MSKVGQTRLYHTSLQFTFIVTYNCHVPILPLTVFHFLYKSRFRILCYFCIEIIPPFLFFFLFWDVTFQFNKLPVQAASVPQKSFPMMYYCKSRTETDLLTTFQRPTFGLRDCRWDFSSAERYSFATKYICFFFYFYSNFLWVIWIQRLIFYGSSWINYPVEFSCCQYQYFCKMIV